MTRLSLLQRETAGDDGRVGRQFLLKLLLELLHHLFNTEDYAIIIAGQRKLPQVLAVEFGFVRNAGAHRRDSRVENEPKV